MSRPPSGVVTRGTTPFRPSACPREGAARRPRRPRGRAEQREAWTRGEASGSAEQSGREPSDESAAANERRASTARSLAHGDRGALVPRSVRLGRRCGQALPRDSRARRRCRRRCSPRWRSRSIHHRGPDFREVYAECSSGCRRCSGRRTTCSCSPPPGPARWSRPSRTSVAGRPGARRVGRQLRRALGADREGVRLRRRRTLAYEWGETPDARRARRAARRARRRQGRLPDALRDLDRCRLPTSRRSRPSRRRPARSSSSTRSRASAPCRSRPTRGASTSSSRARRRR